MKTNYEQIIDITKIGKDSSLEMSSISYMAEQEAFKPAVEDKTKRLLLCIDVQKDFMEGGALAVPGSIRDVERITQFIYNNMEEISSIMCSLDTHIAHQIFHPCWWVNPKGEHPAPYTIITYDDVISNKWKPVIGDPSDSIQYLKELEKAGNSKKQLCIWPYHCISGTQGATLENEFAKMVYFHSIARKSLNKMIYKGTDPYSEMYGIIKPEYSKENFINFPVLKAIKEYDEIYVVGEAKSHCVLESVKQVAEYFSDHPEITQKITVLEDCTSCITGYEAETEDILNNLKELYGIKLEKSTNIQER